jgi:hypothetical protein
MHVKSGCEVKGSEAVAKFLHLFHLTSPVSRTHGLPKGGDRHPSGSGTDKRRTEGRRKGRKQGRAGENSRGLGLPSATDMAGP